MSRHETFVDDPMDDDEGREERTHEGRRDNHGSISGTKFIIGGIAAFFVLCFVVWLVGSKNPETPAGYGNGDGNGDGDGDGYGNGDGDGNGNGYGDGDGNGYGYGRGIIVEC
jgi:hypothetical protein